MNRSMGPLFAMVLFATVPAFGSEVVPVPHFNAIGLEGSASVSLVPGPVERVTIVEGSSRFTRIHVERQGNLKIEACYAQCPHEYRLRVEIQLPRVPNLGVEGGGTISVAGGFGGVHELTTAVSGGGRIDARAVNADVVTAAVNGGGEMFVRAQSLLTGAVSGGGTIRYWGNPQVTSAIDGGGTVRPGY